MNSQNSFSRRNFIQASVVTGLGLTLNLYSCKKSEVVLPEPKPDPPKEDDKSIKITGLSLPAHMDLVKQSEITIDGKGFTQGDQIVFESLTNSSKPKIVINTTVVTDNNILFKLPATVTAEGYRIYVKRGTKTFILGTSVLNFVFNPNIPDVTGMSIKGVVHSSGAGLANVVVSDGIEVAITDSNGIYYLASKKRGKLVFVSIPGNYEVATKGSAPLFFNKLTKPPLTVEIMDFELVSVNNDKHVVMILGDMHLANRNSDIAQFQQGFLKDVNNSIATHKNAGTKVYALTLGDMTWETYWYTTNYGLPQYVQEMNKINAPVFNTMGNHDNNPSYSNNWDAEERYREIIGPTYYSFNLGKAHYIVLDNIEYLNESSSPRNYNEIILPEQLEWLKKDLATVTDKSTPIIIAMHAPLNSSPGVDVSGQQVSNYRLKDSSEFVDTLSGFTDVQLWTGHSHINYTVKNSSSFIEHNLGAVCATWWWTGRSDYGANQICKDGSPGGYGILQMENKSSEWNYKSIDYPLEYQFRAYDLNKVHLTKEKYAPEYTGTSWVSFAGVYANLNLKNEVLINVWGYGPGWNIQVTEDGISLAVQRILAKDPLHIISYSAQRLARNAEPTVSFISSNTAHMFKVKASNPTKSLVIKVTDSYGKVFTETMIRPKEFSYQMK